MRTRTLLATTATLLLLGAACQPGLEPTTVNDDGKPSPSSTPTTTPTTMPTVMPTVRPTPPTPTSTGTAPPAPTSTTAPPPVTPADKLPGIFKDGVRKAQAAPIAGGTLLVTADGKTAVAADPDRDAVYLVDLATHGVRAVPVQPGEELGRVVEGPAGKVFVAARRGGAVLTVDIAAGTVSSRFPVCNAPRGMAYDAAGNLLLVACRSGRLVTLDATSGAEITAVTLDEDLRDVLIAGSSVMVTRFRSAELLRVVAGVVNARGTPPQIGVNSPGVAFRGLKLPNGMLLMAHQVESSSPLGTGLGAYYGGSCAGGGVVQQVLSLVSVDGTALPTPTGTDVTTALVRSSETAPFSIASRLVVGALGPLDLAVSRDGGRVAVVSSGNSWQITSELPNLFLDDLDTSKGGPPANFGGVCNGTAAVAHHLPGEPVAVAFDAAGKYVVQSREPAMLELEGDVFVPLASESRFDTGFAMFHLNTGGGISCASCHPEGGDDGHTWSFSALGLRRSQALEGNVGSRAPFHWSGDLATFTDLFGEVMLKRMALPVVPPQADVQALTDWLDTIPALAPADALDATLVEHGRALFFDATVGCASCHSGPEYSDNLKHDVGTSGNFVTPALTGVGLRAPLMHDGCARSLKDRFGICGGTDHGDISGLSATDIDALVAFMRSI